MALIPHDHVIQALPTYPTDDSFDIRRLPRRLWSNEHFLDSQGLDLRCEVSPIDRISVAQQEAGRRVERKRLYDLPGGPESRGVGRDVEVSDTPSMVVPTENFVLIVSSALTQIEQVVRIPRKGSA